MLTQMADAQFHLSIHREQQRLLRLLIQVSSASLLTYCYAFVCTVTTLQHFVECIITIPRFDMYLAATQPFTAMMKHRRTDMQTAFWFCDLVMIL